jgi:hypothetical protein
MEYSGKSKLSQRLDITQVITSNPGHDASVPATVRVTAYMI